MERPSGSGGAVIVAGPQGSGKTRRATELVARLGCTRVVDEWAPGDALVPGALHLTHAAVRHYPGAQVLQLQELAEPSTATH